MADASKGQELFEHGYEYYNSEDDSLAPKAFDCFSEAADLGNVDAIYYLGVMLSLIHI